MYAAIEIFKSGRHTTGYDVKKNRTGNMYSFGIIDPLKVTKNALRNAVSVATTILQTNCVISNKRA
jgi:chaperonin GroEL